MEQIRSLIACILAAVGAYFAPVGSIFLGVAWVFRVNFIFGLLNGVVAKKESFSFRKAFSCIVEATILYILMVSIFFVGDRIGNPAGAMQCITAVVYALIYFYTVNILKNLKGLLPGSSTVRFLYWILSIEFVRKIPFIGNYIDQFNHSDENGEKPRKEAKK